MSRHKTQPRPVGELVARYSAQEMPTATIETIQRDTARDVAAGELDASDGFRIVNLLLTISLMKIQAIS